MNWFLDMCILIFYANPSESLSLKTRKFVNSKGKDVFVICYYIANKNLPKWVERQRIAIKEIKRYYEDSSYHIGSSQESNVLFKEDIIEAKKMAVFALEKTRDKEKAHELLKRNQEFLINNIKYFIKNFVDKHVININEIDFELKSTLFTFLNNHSDAMTLASGIQNHQKEYLTILTGDKKDWNKDNLNWTFSSRPDLAKKYSKIPEIKYIQDL